METRKRASARLRSAVAMMLCAWVLGGLGTGVGWWDGGSRAWADPYVWDPSTTDWSDGGNWFNNVNPFDFGGFPDGADDTASVGAVGLTATLTENMTIGGLSVTGVAATGTGVSTQNFALTVAGTTNLRFGGELHIFESGTLVDVQTVDLNVLETSAVVFSGESELEVTGTLVMDADAEIRGDGKVQFVGGGGQFNLEGRLLATGGGTLTVERISGTAELDLDGDNELGQLEVGANSTLLITMPLSSSNFGFNGSVDIGEDAQVHIADAWSLDPNAATGAGQMVMAGGGGEATLSGGAFTNSADVFVSSGTGVFAGAFAQDGGTLSVFGGSTVRFASTADISGGVVSVGSGDAIFEGVTTITGGSVSVGEGGFVSFGGGTTISDASALDMSTALNSAVFEVDAVVNITDGAGIFDWDGGGGVQTRVQDGGTLNIAVDRIDSSDNVYDGDILLRGTLGVDVGSGEWQLNGTATVQGGTLLGDRISVTGDLIALGGLATPNEVLAVTHYENGGELSLGSFTSLTHAGSVRFEQGSIIKTVPGAAVLRFEGINTTFAGQDVNNADVTIDFEGDKVTVEGSTSLFVKRVEFGSHVTVKANKLFDVLAEIAVTPGIDFTVESGGELRLDDADAAGEALLTNSMITMNDGSTLEFSRLRMTGAGGGVTVNGGAVLGAESRLVMTDGAGVDIGIGDALTVRGELVFEVGGTSAGVFGGSHGDVLFAGEGSLVIGPGANVATPVLGGFDLGTSSDVSVQLMEGSVFSVHAFRFDQPPSGVPGDEEVIADITVGGGAVLTMDLAVDRAVRMGGTLRFDAPVSNPGEQLGEAILLTPGGRLEGNGELHVAVTNEAGVVSPGLSTGVLRTNDFSQGAAGVLRIEAASGVDHDVLATDDFSAGGVLEVVLLDGYVPSTPDPSTGGVGDSLYIVQTVGEFSGSFDLATGLDFDNVIETGRDFRVFTDSFAGVFLDAFQAAYGDTDGDADVDNDDIFLILGANKFNAGPSSATWAEGDFDHDGDVDNDDVFLILGTNLFNAGPYAVTGPPNLTGVLATGFSATVVPEPAGVLMMLAMSGVFGLRRRRAG